MKDNPKRKNWLLISSLLIVLIVTLMPGDGKVAGNYWDKVIHFAVFLFLSISICNKYIKSKKLIEILFFAIALGFSTEVIQQFIPGRNMDIYDAIADTIGVIIGFYFFRKKL